MGERKKKYILIIKGHLIIFSKNPAPENPMAKSSIKTISSEVFNVNAYKLLFYVYLSCTRFLLSIS